MNKYKALQIKLSKKLSGEFLGDFMSAFIGHGMEFENLREYLPGDSVKKIDWKTTAKQDEPFTKNYREQRDLNALFIFDMSETMLFGSKQKTKLENAQEVFFMLASAASQSGFKISSLVADKYLAPSIGEKNIIRTLDLLESNTDDKGNFIHHPLLKKIKNHLIFIFTDKTDASGLSALSFHNDVVYINVFDSLELSGSDENFVMSLQGMFHIFSKNKKQQYQNTRKATLEKFKNSLREKKIRYLAVDDEHDMMLSFYKFFNKRI